jgi:hypothetical protein
MKRKKMMVGGLMSRGNYKKGGKSFPDLSGDGKVTKKDILMAKGVIKKKGAKNGKAMSKGKSSSKKKV